ncbi:MAG: DNA mismatch repair protein MutS [Planctomycetota bacterium]|nr:MAG: DNA mismatch repair protein MutS [Planctomycetota bacterium]
MSDAERKLTPMMERYLEVKRQHPDSLLLFRMGDFYELFYEDAEIAARTLGLTLTSRDKGSPNPIPMAGFPYHALESYLQKLIRAGFRAAICEQMEDPKKAKGLVKREVTQIVTPGTLTDEALLDPRQTNYLAAIAPQRRSAVGLAWLELSTGQFHVTTVPADALADELARIRPAEVLVSEDAAPSGQLPLLLRNLGAVMTERPAGAFDPETARRSLLKHFGTQTLEGFDVDPESPGVTAAGALIEYVRETQKSELSHIERIEQYRPGTHLIIDEATRRSLELTHTIREGRREGSLLSVIDETVTPMGARLLAEWLSNPLTDRTRIEHRLDAVEELVQDQALCRELRQRLQQTYDLQRLTARIATRRASPRDLGALRATLRLLPALKARLVGRRSQRLRELEQRLDLCEEIHRDLAAALVDEPPTLTTEGGIIREGYNAALDELRDLARGGKQWLAEYQAQQAERLGIPNLKIGFNRVFGYYLEVTATHAAKVPEDYIRKQTLKNQERFVTPELKRHEEKLLRAEDQARSLEQELFHDLRERVALETLRLKRTAETLAELDVLCGLATLAVHQRYSRPEIVEEPILELKDSRHPVLDRLQPTGQFVPNDVTVGDRHGFIQIITGPNMAGKSTYIRQAALTVILAQMGSFVPARAARVGIADRVFARVGASDELGRGQSTFMVEMTEAARILNAATRRSLVILDEIGRGTSTYDGISLAWAITEYLHDVIGCRTLFATHYHELTALTQSLTGARNWNVAVREQGDRIYFLHRIVPGAADKSYGIHVAQLAGVPLSIIERARVILRTLESDHVDERGRTKIPPRPKPRRRRQLLLFPEIHPVLDQLRDVPVEQLSPEDALQTLKELKRELEEPSRRG